MKLISLQVLLVQLHSLLKSCSGLQPGLQTQRRPHVFWPKRGEKPGYNGRERSRSTCKERRLKGNKHLHETEALQRQAIKAVVSLYLIFPGGVAKNWSAGGQRSEHDSRPRLSVS